MNKLQQILLTFIICIVGLLSHTTSIQALRGMSSLQATRNSISFNEVIENNHYNHIFANVMSVRTGNNYNVLYQYAPQSSLQTPISANLTYLGVNRSNLSYLRSSNFTNEMIAPYSLYIVKLYGSHNYQGDNLELLEYGVIRTPGF